MQPLRAEMLDQRGADARPAAGDQHALALEARIARAFDVHLWRSSSGWMVMRPPAPPDAPEASRPPIGRKHAIMAGSTGTPIGSLRLTARSPERRTTSISSRAVERHIGVGVAAEMFRSSSPCRRAVGALARLSRVPHVPGECRFRAGAASRARRQPHLASGDSNRCRRARRLPSLQEVHLRRADEAGHEAVDAACCRDRAASRSARPGRHSARRSCRPASSPRPGRG